MEVAHLDTYAGVPVHLFKYDECVAIASVDVIINPAVLTVARSNSVRRGRRMLVLDDLSSLRSQSVEIEVPSTVAPTRTS